MRILVGCEESGKVRDEFIKRDFDAVSCDLLPSRRAGPHLQMDVADAILLHGPWDIIILFPDCTAMAVSGNKHYGRGMPKHALRLEAVRWTENLWNIAKEWARIGCAIENPGSVLWTAIGKPQYIQPYQFGHGETKKTGILTDRLPKLVPTNQVEGREHRIWKMGPSPDRKRLRGETFDGIAEAIAEQYGQHLRTIMAQSMEGATAG